MSCVSHIITISKTTPEHWDYAVQAGFWDFTQNPVIEPGDKLYFWQSAQDARRPGRFVGVAEATTSTYPSEGRTMPWRRDENRPKVYKNRVDLIALTDSLASEITAQDLADRGYVRRGPDGYAVMNAGLFPVTHDEDWLQEKLLDEGIKTSEAILIQPKVHVRIDPIPDVDRRENAWRQVISRQGQGAFRRRVLLAYGGQCLVTGCDFEVLLDAAHIAPYRGAHTQRTDNGLLLRTDLHTLFDAHMMTFVYGADDILRVRMSPDLGEPYAQYNGSQVRMPLVKHDQPVAADLAIHHTKCGWLATSHSI